MSESPAVVDLRRGIATAKTLAVRQAMAEGIIAVAAKARDWPLLHEAVDIKIGDQRAFVVEWDVKVKEGRPSDKTLTRSVRVSVLERESGLSEKQVSRWRKSLANPLAYHDKLVLAACRKAGLEPEENHRAEGTGENEWFTPAQYIAAAREVMGAIDLDPATHVAAQETVEAAQFYTRADDGLTKQWHGRVWLNPPYAQPHIARFAEKMVEEYESGRVSQAIMLTHNYTDTAWFHFAASTAAMICFTRGRIRFVDIDGEECAPTQGQAFFYYGTACDEFASVFAEFGLVLRHA